MHEELLTLRIDVLTDNTSLTQRLLDLNNTHSIELSWLEHDRLTDLIAQAFVAACTSDGGALLISLDQDADYDNPNFKWFCERYDRFVYIDRVVVSPHARGQGYARQLYNLLFQRARLAGHALIVCEINVDPPNPASDAFHERIGFEPVGYGSIQGGAKAVRYMSRRFD